MSSKSTEYGFPNESDSESRYDQYQDSNSFKAVHIYFNLTF